MATSSIGRPDRGVTADRDDALLAVARALTDDETADFLRAAVLAWPRMDGAEVAGVLDETAARDLFLDITGPFFERNGQLRENPGTIYALHALIILARDVAVMDVLGLLLRAGLISERQLDWKEGINGWLAHGRADDYFVSGDIYGQVRLTRWVRHPAIIGDLPDVLGDGQFLDNLTGQFAAEVLANSVLVPSEQYGRDMAQAHEEGNPSIAARAWQGARQSR